jgi:hypothetical protein
MAARTNIRCLAGLLLVVAAAPGVRGQTVRDPADNGKTALQKLIDESIAWYELSAGPDLEARLKPMPVLRWDNNTRGSGSGLTVLYLAGGRPEVVCCIYPWEQKLYHEFSSLSSGPISARREGVVVWRPQKPGLTFRTVPNAPPPADSASARLRQIKRLFRRFEATLVGWKADDSDRQELRPLPRALYRYEEPRGEIIDGAVFAYVMGTDPEVLLLIEAVAAESGPEWRYAFVRRTSGELEGRLDGDVVWTAERYPDTSDPTSADRTIGVSLAGLLDPNEPAARARAAQESTP